MKTAIIMVCLFLLLLAFRYAHIKKTLRAQQRLYEQLLDRIFKISKRLRTHELRADNLDAWRMQTDGNLHELRTKATYSQQLMSDLQSDIGTILGYLTEEFEPEWPPENRVIELENYENFKEEKGNDKFK